MKASSTEFDPVVVLTPSFRSDGVPHLGLAPPLPGCRQDRVEELVRGLHGSVHAAEAGADPPGAPHGVAHHTAPRSRVFSDVSELQTQRTDREINK